MNIVAFQRSHWSIPPLDSVRSWGAKIRLIILTMEEQLAALLFGGGTPPLQIVRGLVAPERRER